MYVQYVIWPIDAAQGCRIVEQLGMEMLNLQTLPVECWMTIQ
jgi:hypothetical protein